jgi:mycofactocin precursor peptide MftA
MPYSDDDCDRIDPVLSRPDERQVRMDHETAPETDTDTELVTETLVEEVSIDGMCGVY